jgi:hypothetical protein
MPPPARSLKYSSGILENYSTNAGKMLQDQRENFIWPTSQNTKD